MHFLCFVVVSIFTIPDVELVKNPGDRKLQKDSKISCNNNNKLSSLVCIGINFSSSL